MPPEGCRPGDAAQEKQPEAHRPPAGTHCVKHSAHNGPPEACCPRDAARSTPASYRGTAWSTPARRHSPGKAVMTSLARWPRPPLASPAALPGARRPRSSNGPSGQDPPDGLEAHGMPCTPPSLICQHSGKPQHTLGLVGHILSAHTARFHQRPGCPCHDPSTAWLATTHPMP